MKSVGRRFKDLLESDGVTIAPGATDMMSCLIFQELGFKTIWAGGFMASGCLIGWPDTNVLSLSEHATYVRNIVQTTGLPVFVDIDNGYGSAINVIRTVREMEAAGAAAMLMEDQVVPKRCALFPGNRPIIPVQEMVGKIKAFVDTRKDPDLVLVGRTDSFGAGLSVGEAIDRAGAYVEAGADAIIPISKHWDNLEQFARRSKLGVPLVTGPTLFPHITTRYLEEVGYKLMIQPLAPAQIIVKALRESMAILQRDGSPQALVDRMCSFDELKDLFRLGQVVEWEERYIPEGTSLSDAHRHTRA